MLSNAEMVNKEGLGKLKCNLSTLYMDYLNRNGYKLTEEEKSRKVKEFVKKAVDLVEDESYYTLDFIAFLSSIHSI